MKVKIIASLCVALFLSGCDNFLEQSAQDLLIPETVAQYKEILQGEANFENITNNYLFIAHMSDDVEFFDERSIKPDVEAKEDTRMETYFESYTWAAEVENSAMTDKCFEYLYKHALVANLCLESLEELSGSDEEKEILRGQASFVRAFSYFMLANIYSKPYNKASADDLCVPIKLTSTPNTDTYGRATVKEVWDLITGDIQTALTCLKGKNISNLYEVNYKAALVLATRIALYMENWDAVINYGEKELLAMEETPLYDITDRTQSTVGGNAESSIKNFINSDNKEIVFVFGNYSNGNAYHSYFAGRFTANAYFRASLSSDNSLIGLYDYDATLEEGDRRLPYWFIPPNGTDAVISAKYDYRLLKYDATDGDLNGQFALRSGEVYLSLAEAYARKSDSNKAISYLNELREKRIKPYTPLVSGDFASNQELLRFVWEERRRELCFEELHRWWDLRRTEQPKVVHQWRNGTYTLQQEDPAYVLNFPTLEREYNGGKLLPNNRPVRTQD